MPERTSAAPTVTVRGIEVPRLLYGTAWKEERTAALVRQALAAGFRGIDTANQRRHYHEAGVGAALAEALAEGSVTRKELFLQTKFTYPESQDARLPFDPHASYATQVHQSFESSLSHLEVDRLDSLLLHGPRSHVGLAQGDLEVWRAMEDLQREGRVALIGISNVRAAQLAELCELAQVPPAFVQNRCFARLGWDRQVRGVCRTHGVVYQGFSLLTANQAEVASPLVRSIAEARGATPEQVIFRFALGLGMICLTGTSDPRHMEEDLAAPSLELSQEEVAALERISG